jgi:hypothetical protein
MSAPKLLPRRHAVGSAEVPLLEACPAAGAVTAERPEKMEPWLWWGIFIHRFLEYAQTRGRSAALSYIREKFPRGLGACTRIDVDSIPRGLTEVALAHNVGGGLARRLHKDSPRADPAEETYGRADLIFFDEGMLHVADWKTGEAKGVTPAGNPQLMGLAAAARAEACREGEPVRASIVAVPSSGHLVWRTAEFPSDLLGHYVERQRRVLPVVHRQRRALELGERLDYRPGPHCEDCYTRPACPAHELEARLRASVA